MSEKILALRKFLTFCYNNCDAEESSVMATTMDVLLNGQCITTKGELQSLYCMMGKTMSPFG